MATDRSTELAPIVDRLAVQYEGTFDRATVTQFVETATTRSSSARRR
jgi:hypothetical protein